jgi:hypothetical protein
MSKKKQMETEGISVRRIEEAGAVVYLLIIRVIFKVYWA